MNAVDRSLALKRELSALAALGVVTRGHLRRCFEYIETRYDEVGEWFDNGASIEQAADMVRDFARARP